MSQKTQPVLAFVTHALTASQVGTWETDYKTDRSVADATTAELFGIDPDEAEKGLPLVAYTRNIHPEDVSEFEEKLGSIRYSGGLFVIEYRTCPSPNKVRWVLARGRYEYDPRTGDIVGRGIVIDITESKFDGQVEDRAFFVESQEASTSLERLANLAIRAHAEIEELGEAKDADLHQAVNALLWAVGRAVAREQDAAKKQGPRFN